MKAELIKKRRMGRLLRVITHSGEFVVEYNGYGIGHESVLVDKKVAARAISWVRAVPRFNFAVGPHLGLITIETRLWRDLLAPILGRLESFRFELDGHVVYED